MSYAQGWCRLLSKERLGLNAATDPHAPNEFRVKVAMNPSHYHWPTRPRAPLKIWKPLPETSTVQMALLWIQLKNVRYYLTCSPLSNYCHLSVDFQCLSVILHFGFVHPLVAHVCKSISVLVCPVWHVCAVFPLYPVCRVWPVCPICLVFCLLWSLCRNSRKSGTLALFFHYGQEEGVFCTIR